MTITIPSGRTLPLKAKAGGGFQSNGIVESSGQGYIAFDVPVIEHSTTGGTIPVRLVRRRGSSGSVTVQLSALDKFRAQGVQSYAGESVTFADGEMTKIVNVPLNSITLDGEAHFYLNVTITNALIPGVRWHELNAVVVVDDGSIASDGIVLSDPSTQIIQDNIASNTITYLRTGTWDDFSTPGYSELVGNNGKKGTSFTGVTNSVLRNYPGESPVITSSASDAVGVYIRSNGYHHLKGIELTGGSLTASFLPVWIDQLTDRDEYIYVYGNHIHDWYGDDNVGGVRVDDGYRCAVFNNRIHDGYDTRVSSNTINSVAAGLHAGVHGYAPVELFVYQNTIYNIKRAMYRKDPSPLGGMTNLFARNLVYANEGAAADYSYAGAKDLANFDFAVFENVCLNCPVSGFLFADNTGSDDSARALIYNNLSTGGEEILSVRDLIGIQVWNNLVVGGSSSDIVFSLDGRDSAEVTYCDYNGYEFDYRWLIGRNATLRSYDSFAQWQASNESQSTDNQVPANPDANGALGTPVFAGVDDWHLDETDTLFRNQGRFAQESIGAYRLGHEQIGATI